MADWTSVLMSLNRQDEQAEHIALLVARIARAWSRLFPFTNRKVSRRSGNAMKAWMPLKHVRLMCCLVIKLYSQALPGFK